VSNKTGGLRFVFPLMAGLAAIALAGAAWPYVTGKVRLGPEKQTKRDDRPGPATRP
jgi:hypothetical protein